MESLESVLRQVENLKRDLYAEIVIQEERGHDECVGSRIYRNYKDLLYGYEYVVDQPRIAEPDVQKRETTRIQLQEISDSSEWYSARYAAENALGMFTGNQFKSWVEVLKGQLIRSPDRTTRKKARQDLEYMYKNLPCADHRRIAGKTLGYSGLRIWAHEHPSAVITGIAVAGPTLGFVYGLAEHFTK